MFIQHKQLTFLSAPASRVVQIQSSPSAIQLAFSGHPPQPCRAYLLQLGSGGKALVIIAFYLLESHSSVFFVPEKGEVSLAAANDIYDEGIEFVESMGFILTESDFQRLSPAEKQIFWGKMPITHPPETTSTKPDGLLPVNNEEELQRLREQSLTSLGRYLASM